MGGPSDDKSGQLDYERPDTDTFKDLVTLVKKKSPKFAEMIEKQEFTVKQTNETSLEHQAIVKDDDGMGDDTFRSEHNAYQQKEQQQDKEKKKTQTKTQLEPSLKWKALG